jgi:hypothetical protein
MTVDVSQVPIACNLSEADLALREAEIADDLFRGCEQVEELADGYGFKFGDVEQWAGRLLSFVLEERKCCPFFIFDLLFEPQEGPIWLQLRGDERVKLFVKENFLGSLSLIESTST